MSVAVAVDKLADELQRYGNVAYVLTSGTDGRPHISHVTVRLADGTLQCEVGNGSAANARSSAKVALLWPPTEAGGYSLIVDADAAVTDTRLVLTPTRAVRHRPAPALAGDPQ